MSSWGSALTTPPCRNIPCSGVGTVFNQCELLQAFWKNDVIIVPLVWRHSGKNALSKNTVFVQWKYWPGLFHINVGCLFMTSLR